MDLVRIDTAAENDFVRSHIDGDWWIGASDQGTEGAWVWAIGGSQFWSGQANGNAVGGLFSRWDGGQPNNLGNEDCAHLAPDGDWLDDSCSDSEEYICEFAVDACPSDPNKSVPGACGCGTPDTDSDNDGTPNCHDECPNDASKIVPGDCGCAQSPKPVGTACNDGICAANNQCDGAGKCGAPSACAPDQNCTLALFESTPYWFCDEERSFAAARQRCLAVGMDLVAIETPAEDEFVTSIIDEHVWIGSTDAPTQGDWKWLGTDKLFWTGGSNGGPFGGAYANWEQNDPDYGIDGDCAAKDPPAGDGKWETFECSHTKAYVCERMLDLHPTLKCVRRSKGPEAVALFGYDNQSPVAVVVPHGPKNRLSPASSTAPPREFEPGVHDRAFFIPFDRNGTMTWDLAGEQAVASGSSPLCQLGDVPPGQEPKPAPPVREIDRPAVPFASIANQVGPDVPTSSHLAAPIFGSERGPEAGNTSNEEAGPAPFTFTVHSLNFGDGEGACGSVDPFVNHLHVDGQDFGESNSGTVQVARDRRTLHVTVDVDDADSFLCFGDEDLRVYELDIDLFTGASNVCIDGGRMCFSATPIASPSVCMGWNAQYVDAGPWSGIGSEDFLASKDRQFVAASFARYRFKMETSAGVIFDRGGVLDKDGCIPGPKLPIRAHWQLGTDLKMTARLISQHCLDPDKTDCPLLSSLKGANVMVREGNQTGPGEYCSALAENASTLPPGCLNLPIGWSVMPPTGNVTFGFTEEDAITRTSAVISHLFKREAETNGGLGIGIALGQRRFGFSPTNTGLVQVEVNKFCSFSDPCQPTAPPRLTSCGGGETLTLEPDAALASATRFKNVIAHEFGHVIQDNGMGLLNFNLGCGAGAPGLPPLCRCDHVPFDQQTHCLQSFEEPGVAQNEGYGYFYSAKSFNTDLQADCTFSYGKPVANTACLPGAVACTQDPATGFFVTQPPVPVNCRQAIRWRNTQCVDAQSSPDLLASGVEWDWVEFFYGINNLMDANQRWNLVDIFDAYRSACGGSATTMAVCRGSAVSWVGGPNHASLVGAVVSMAQQGLKTAAARDAFVASGNDFGVSNLP